MDIIFQNENLILLAILIVGLFVLVWQVFLLFKILQCKNWNKTEGEVISSNLGVVEFVGEVDESYRVKIKYQYFVNENKFVSSRVYFGDKLSSSFKLTYTNLLEKYPAGKKIEVFYNPIKIEESIIERKIAIGIVFMLIVSLSAIIVSLYFLDFSTLKQMFNF